MPLISEEIGIISEVFGIYSHNFGKNSNNFGKNRHNFGSYCYKWGRNSENEKCRARCPACGLKVEKNRLRLFVVFGGELRKALLYCGGDVARQRHLG